MGWSPSDLRSASLWQFLTAYKGWRRANCPPDPPKPPTRAQFETADWDF